VRHLIADGSLAIRLEDEIIRETLVTHRGEWFIRACGSCCNSRGRPQRRLNSMQIDESVSVCFQLAAFLGFELVRRVAHLLHTP